MIKAFFVELIYRFIWPAIANWVQRAEKDKTRDAQTENDARDRGDADDVIARLRGESGDQSQRSDRERDKGGNLPEADDERGADTRG